MWDGVKCLADLWLISSCPVFFSSRGSIRGGETIDRNFHLHRCSVTCAVPECFQDAADLLDMCGSSVEAVPSSSSHTGGRDL